ncbi:MAG: TonB-dependent receptor, partial [Bacteroidota bacterium]
MTRSALVLFLLVLAAWSPPAWAQVGTVRGFITDAANGAPLELVNVVLNDADGFVKGTVTNGDGLYLLSNVRPGAYELVASYIGYVAFRDSVVVGRGDVLTRSIRLATDEAQMNELVVESERLSGTARVTAGQQTIRAADVEMIPTPDVSGDLAALLSALPSVVSTGDRGGQLFVRGGEPTQNLVQLDGITLYQPFHVLGFYSAFPADLISRADVFAGGFGSDFGERISSVIDVSSRTGNMQRFEGSLSASPFVSGVRVEGPLVPGRVSLIASGRLSTIDQGATRWVDAPLPFQFSDTFGKLNLSLSENQRLSFTGLYTYDRGTLGEDLGGLPPDEIRWNNQGFGARYLLLPNLFPVSFEATGSYTLFDASLGPDDDPSRTTRVENLQASIDATFYGARSDVKAGLSLRQVFMESNLGGTFQNIDARRDEPLHWSLYLEPEFKVTSALSIRPGLRMQFYDVRFAPYLEPRLRVLWDKGIHTISGAAGFYTQAEIGLSDRRDAASIFTAWTMARRPLTRVEDISEGRVQEAWHGIVGYQVRPTPWLDLSVEAYGKRLSNLFIGEWTAFPRFTTNLQPATGRSFGFDLRGEVRRPRFTASLTYGYANTRYDAEQAELELWYGTET